MKKLFSLLIVLAFFVLPAQSQTTPAHRVVMQLSTNDTLVWKGLMNNLKNLKAGWGDSLQVEVVTHGPGIDFLTAGKTTQQEKIAYFTSMGIRFIACENSMMERKVPASAMIPQAEFVRMGVGEIIRKQEQGWTYIKVGF